MRTITGREIKVSPNHSAKTFTIRTESGKYRTNRMSKDEFYDNIHNTGNDWQEYLNGAGSYYKIK